MNKLGVLLLVVALPLHADGLAGLWKARRWFGPEARGTVIVQPSGDAYVADMVGQSVPVRVEGKRLSFALRNGQGTFRGTLHDDGAIRGHWYPPRSIPRGAVYASSAELKADGAGRWRGEIVPFDDTFTFYLMLTKRDEGSFGAFLRNPERDHGTQMGIERLTVDGNAVALIGKRRGEERVEARGTYDAERDVLTLTFPFRGGTYDFRRDDDESHFWPRGKTPPRYTYRPPPARDDGWPVSTLDAVNIDRAAIETFIQQILDTPRESTVTPVVEGILIARDGKLVVEEYFHGEHRDKLHDTRSAAKSLTAVLVGAAMQAGANVRLDTPVYADEASDPRKKSMTLEHLLTMSAGFFCDDTNPDAPGNENFMQDGSEEPDYYRFALRVPQSTAPGEVAVYCSMMPNLALGVLQRATGENAMETFDRLVARPMRWGRYGWFLDRAGNPYGGGSVHVLPRDFIKLGQLMLDGGTWQGKRVLSREFVARATSPLYRLREQGYGYLWWVVDRPYRDRAVRLFYAGGAGGQSVNVVPELGLVVATLGGNYADAKATHAISRDLTAKFILPAVKP